MLSLLGIGKIQAVVAAVVLAAAATVMGMLWLQNRSLNSENDILRGNNVVLETSLEMERGAVRAAVANADLWQDAMDQLQRDVEKMSAAQQAARQETRRLNEIFNDHDLEALAAARPGLVERRVNSGSADAIGVLHDITSGGGRGPSGVGEADPAGPAPAAADPES